MSSPEPVTGDMETASKSDISIASTDDLEVPSENFDESAYSSPEPTPQDAQKHQFFNFPLNIRAEIYHYALVPGKIHVRSLNSPRCMSESDQSQLQNHLGPNTALFTVCRRIHEESRRVFYRDNIFSITNPDILQDAIGNDALVCKHLEYMHKVEIVFNCQEFEYMRGPFEDELRIGVVAMNHMESEKANKKFLKMRAKILGAGLYHVGESVSSESEDGTSHDRAIRGLYACVFDRSLAFVRQKLLVTDLYIDMAECLCPEGCCRLADRVMGRDWDKGWTFGLPHRISVCGATEEEQERVFDSITPQ